MDSTVHSGGLEQKASSSENGPGVDIYAPGSNIMSACSTINEITNGDYPSDSTFKICNISGTSMASPQVCGVGALLLQANPHATPSQLKSLIIANVPSPNIIKNCFLFIKLLIILSLWFTKYPLSKSKLNV